MLEPIHAICLRITRHSDTSSIATIWTRERGRLAVAIPAGGGRGATRMKAMTMPMSLIEGIADIKPGGEIARLRDVRPYKCGNPAAGNPARTVSALFVCDLLCSVLRQSPPDSALTDFLFEAATALGNASGTALANFHLVFMYRLGHFLGIEPDIGSYTPGAVFDMREALFRITAPSHHDILVGDEAAMVHTLSRTRFANMGALRLSRTERNRILDCIIAYYGMHLIPLASLSSLDVVRSIFS